MTFKVNDYNVHRFLDLSTAHVPKATATALGDLSGPLHDGCEGLMLLPYDYGWIVWSANDTDKECLNAHPELRDLIRFADANGFYALKFDCDAEPLEGAPTFNW